MRRLNVWNQGFDAFETESGKIASPPVACWRTFFPLHCCTVWESLVSNLPGWEHSPEVSGRQGVCESAPVLAWPWASRGVQASLWHMGECRDRSGCLLTSSFMGKLASAFLSAESGRKVGQSACGVQLRQRERKNKKTDPEVGQQTAREAVVATAEFSSPEGLLGASHGSLAVLLTAPGGNETPGVNDDSLWLVKKLGLRKNKSYTANYWLWWNSSSWLTRAKSHPHLIHSPTPSLGNYASPSPPSPPESRKS